jgi:hypothetical protein
MKMEQMDNLHLYKILIEIQPYLKKKKKKNLVFKNQNIETNQ